jgi:hypothetical protein
MKFVEVPTHSLEGVLMPVFRLTIKSLLASWKGEGGEWKIHRVILKTDKVMEM